MKDRTEYWWGLGEGMGRNREKLLDDYKRKHSIESLISSFCPVCSFSGSFIHAFNNDFFFPLCLLCAEDGGRIKPSSCPLGPLNLRGE